MAAGRHLGFDATGNGPVRSAVLENFTWPFEILAKCENWPCGRSSVVKIHIPYTDLILLFRYVSNLPREE